MNSSDQLFSKWGEMNLGRVAIAIHGGYLSTAVLQSLKLGTSMHGIVSVCHIGSTYRATITIIQPFRQFGFFWQSSLIIIGLLSGWLFKNSCISYAVIFHD